MVVMLRFGLWFDMFDVLHCFASLVAFSFLGTYPAKAVICINLSPRLALLGEGAYSAVYKVQLM